MKLEKFKCKKCKSVFIADTRHHHMDSCPGCNKSYVDLEEYGCRLIGSVEFIEPFDTPWFDDEDEYHSALLSWLNDSDEEYELTKDYDTEILTILRL